MEPVAPEQSIDEITRHNRPTPYRRLVAVFAVLALAGAFWLTTDRELIAEWKADAGPIPFFIGLAVLPAVGFPTTPFFVLAGAMFGLWTGLIGCAAAIATNQMLCYWISHSGLRPWIERRMSRTKYKIPDFSESKAGALRFTLLLRIAPGLPTFLKSYVLGLSGVPFWIYFWVSFVFTGLYAVSFIILGESIFDRDFGTAGVAIGALVLIGCVVAWFRFRNKKKLKETLGLETPEKPPGGEG